MGKKEPFPAAARVGWTQAELPNPDGPPMPVATNESSAVNSAITAITVLACGGVGFALLIGSGAGRTCGATRSAQLQWEQRQTEVNQIVAEELAQREAELPQELAGE
jgi:hypothetical protein